MAPCVVLEKLEGKQQCSRAPVGEHAEVQAQDAECGCHEQQEVNEKRPKPSNSPSHNHDSTTPRQHSLIYTGAGPIHPVYGPLWLPATEAMPRKDSHFRHFGGLFLPRTSLLHLQSYLLPARFILNCYVSCGCWQTCRRSSTSISLGTKRKSGMSVSSGVGLAHSAIIGM